MNAYIMNPFKFEGIVTGSDFCDRKEDIKELLDYMYSSNNVIISMKRRVGKSSIIKEIFKNHIKDNRTLTGYVDIYGITSTKELYMALKEEVEKISTASLRIGIPVNRLKKAFSNSLAETIVVLGR